MPRRTAGPRGAARRSKCASACRCEPAAAASRPARGANAATAPPSPARNGVVHEPGRVVAVAAQQRVEHGAVQRAAAQRGQPGLDRAAGQLVAEREPVGPHLEDAVPLGLGERVQRVAEQRARPGRTRPSSGTTASCSTAARQRSGRAAPCGPAPRRTPCTGTAEPPAREHLGDVERVAPGQRVQPGAVLAGLRGELRDGRRRQRQPAAAGHGAAPASAPEQRRSGCSGRARRGRSAAARPAASRCGGPGGRARPAWRRRPSAGPRRRARSASRSSARAAPNTASASAAVQRGRERPAGPGRRVAQRAERALGQQVVARPDEHPGPPGRRPERPHDARLADSRLAGHQHHRAPAGVRVAHRPGQRREHRPPLQRPAPRHPHVRHSHLVIGGISPPGRAS